MLRLFIPTIDCLAMRLAVKAQLTATNVRGWRTWPPEHPFEVGRVDTVQKGASNALAGVSA